MFSVMWIRRETCSPSAGPSQGDIPVASVWDKLLGKSIDLKGRMTPSL